MFRRNYKIRRNIGRYPYPMPSFLDGVSRLLDIRGTSRGAAAYYLSKTPEEIDSEAIASDWQNVGDDVRYALNEFKKKYLND